MSKSSKNILVTGGAGFIGSHMADRLLSDGHTVYILDNETTGHRENVPTNAIYAKGDVRSLDDLDPIFAKGLDVVFHIAGQASTVTAFTDPVEDLSTNVEGTINIIQKCIEYSVPRLLFASSMTAYGLVEPEPVSETQPCVPISYYGVTKYAAERYVLATAERNDLETPLKVTAFRMFNVYGDRQRLDNPYQGVMGIFIGHVLREEPITIYGDGKQSRDFVHISDVVNLWVQAMDDPNAENQVFNIGNGQDQSITTLADTIIDVCGYGDQEYPIYYKEERAGDQRFMQADISLAESRLGWKPQVSFRQGVEMTVEWARKNL